MSFTRIALSSTSGKCGRFTNENGTFSLRWTDYWIILVNLCAAFLKLSHLKVNLLSFILLRFDLESKLRISGWVGSFSYGRIMVEATFKR